MNEHWSLRYARHVCEKLDLTPSALARRAGISPTTLTRPLGRSGHSAPLSRATLDAIQATSGIAYAGFSGNSVPATVPVSDGLVNVFSVSASAGHGALIEDEVVVDRLAFPPGYLASITRTASRHLAIIAVRGDSMLPTLKHEDAVMLDQTKRSLAFDGLFVLRFDGELHVKRVGRGSTAGQVQIISDNRIEFPSFERRIEDVEVVGKVIWLGKKV